VRIVDLSEYIDQLLHVIHYCATILVTGWLTAYLWITEISILTQPALGTQ